MIEHEFLTGGKLRYDHLLNREWKPPQFDCYSMACDMFKDNCRVELTNYARPDDWWIQEGFDLYNDHFYKEGFRIVEIKHVRELLPMDGILMALPDLRRLEKTVTNHCSVYVGDGNIVHHLIGRRSQHEPYRGAYRNYTTMVIRHKDIPNLSDQSITKVDLMDRILPSKRAMLMGVMNDRKPKE